MTHPKIIALEGVGGAGKSTLAPILAHLLSATVIKRPLTSPPMNVQSVEDWMDEDCAAALARAHQAPTPAVILDRHWLSACVYQAADQWPDCIASEAAAWGEPDVWVIMSASAPEIIHRLAARPADGRHHLDDSRRLHIIAGRIALYDDAPRHLRAPIVHVRHVPPSAPVSYARWEVVGTRTPSAHLPSPLPPEDLARVVAAHVRATLEVTP